MIEFGALVKVCWGTSPSYVSRSHFYRMSNDYFVWSTWYQRPIDLLHVYFIYATQVGSTIMSFDVAFSCTVFSVRGQGLFHVYLK